jgi:uncharacterized protein involved in type VI secretion and phage assembly
MKTVDMLPHLLVQIDGVALEHSLSLALKTVAVQQELSLPALCELAFFYSDRPRSTEPLVEVGSRLRVALAGIETELFLGRITAVEYLYRASHEREIRVRAYDELHCLRLRQPVRTHVQITLADLATELVSDLGLEVIARDPGPLWDRTLQYHQTDLELLVELAESAGLFFTLRGQQLHIHSLEGIDGPLSLTWGHNLYEAHAEINGAIASRHVTVQGWNPSLCRLHEATATSARTTRLEEIEMSFERLGGSGMHILADTLVNHDDHAQAVAQGVLDRRAGNEVTLRGTVEGDPNLRPGVIIETLGIASHLAGRYCVTAVTHVINAEQGFISQFSTIPPLAKARKRSAVVTLGTVSKTNDPERLGRAQVSLPALNNIETGWLQILGIGAGKGKGLVALPALGDQVLVLFLQENPAQSVILGSLYGMAGAPTPSLHSGGHCFSLLTAGGQGFSLDDQANRIRFHNRSGSYVEMTASALTIHSATDLEITAPGRQVVIRANAIDFQQG